jgi:periplasmic protein TonB
MFEDSFLERKVKGQAAATILSFTLQILLVGVLVLIPMVITQALPVGEIVTTLVAAPPPPPPPPPAAAPKVAAAKPVVRLDELRQPLRIPEKVAMVRDNPQPADATPSSVAGVVGGVPSGTAGGQIGGVIGGILSSVPAAAPKVATPDRVRISQGISEGLLLNKVLPEYPPMAKEARIQGQVVLQAVIGKDGAIQDLHVVRGHPLLTSAALNAVKQWRYKPYLLNGQPTEVETLITVNFTMGSA